MYLYAVPLLSLLVFSSALEGQIIFPGLEGEALRDALVTEYKTDVVLSLSDAKDTLYAIIDQDQDSVRGIYTGFAVYLEPGEDPSQSVFQNGSGINLEHSWPRSKGANEGTQGHSDMHHLYPSRVAVNSARASLPFADIPDDETETWYVRGISMSSIPQTNIDSYSESGQVAFEPRESVKGDIARAQFYFYTMYQAEADAADPQYFETQRLILLQWHQQDPANDQEVARNIAVAEYQGAKQNPYVLDATLAERAFCVEPECMTTSTMDQLVSPEDLSVAIDGCRLRIQCSTGINVKRVEIRSLAGRLAAVIESPVDNRSLCHLPAAFYVALIFSEAAESSVLNSYRFFLSR